jgi:hypothetical protein
VDERRHVVRVRDAVADEQDAQPRAVAARQRQIAAGGRIELREHSESDQKDIEHEPQHQPDGGHDCKSEDAANPYSAGDARAVATNGRHNLGLSPYSTWPISQKPSCGSTFSPLSASAKPITVDMLNARRRVEPDPLAPELHSAGSGLISLEAKEDPLRRSV